MIDKILFILALICFGVAAAGVPCRVNLVAQGLFFATLTTIV